MTSGARAGARGARARLNVSLTRRRQRVHSRSVTDAAGARRRLAFSTAFVEAKVTPLHVQVPLGAGLRRGGWTNVALNVAQLLPALFGGALLRSIDTITLGARARAAATPDESHGVS